MENRTKFDLNKNVENWKLQLFNKKKMSNENIEELESHLYDEISKLKEIGLEEDEAFLISKKRIGKIDVITSEYEKINKKLVFKNKIEPYIKGILFFIAFLTITELLTNMFLYIGIKIRINNSYLKIVTIGILVLSTITFYWFLFNKFRNSRNSIIDKLNKIPILVLLIIFTKSIYFFSSILLTKTIILGNYSTLSMNLSIFKISFTLLLLIFSIVLFINHKKEKRILIVN